MTTINSEEGPAFGVALLAAVGGGEYADIVEACRATIRVVGRTDPDENAVAAYRRGMEIYQSLYRSLKGEFKKIASLETTSK